MSGCSLLFIGGLKSFPLKEKTSLLCYKCQRLAHLLSMLAIKYTAENNMWETLAQAMKEHDPEGFKELIEIIIKEIDEI